MTQRVALVTGGTRGIGAAVAKSLFLKGYKVIVTYLQNDEQARLFEKKTGIQTLKWDASSLETCNHHIEKIEKELGPIDILINNAGVTQDVMFHKMKEHDWSHVIGTNLTSCYTMSRAVIDNMRKRNFGRIVNISSINGQTGQFGQTNYSAAKAGMLGFTKALALENAGKGITVNAIAPGYIATDMVSKVKPDVLDQIISKIPVGRLGLPEDIARAVCFLVDDEASFITGSTLTVNGGQYLV
jgi:acetoacetyl-CoA reductase